MNTREKKFWRREIIVENTILMFIIIWFMFFSTWETRALFWLSTMVRFLLNLHLLYWKFNSKEVEKEED